MSFLLIPFLLVLAAVACAPVAWVAVTWREVRQGWKWGPPSRRKRIVFWVSLTYPVAAMVSVAVSGTLTLLLVLTMPAAAVSVRMLTREERQHKSRWVLPLHQAIAAHAGWDEKSKPGYLSVSADLQHAVVVLSPQAAADPNRVKKIIHAVPQALDMAACDVEERLHGGTPALYFTAKLPAAPIPGRVSLEDALPYMDGLGRKELFKGFTVGGEPHRVSLKADAPHTILSWETGGGKSSAITSDAMQLAHKGWVVIILDSTGISYPWAKDLPNIYYAQNAAMVRTGLFWLSDEIRRRNQYVHDNATLSGYVEGGFGPDLFVVCDEKNLTEQLLNAAWQEDGNKGRDPALGCIDAVLYAGRKINVHTILGCVRASAAAVGGGDQRAQAGIVEFGPNPRQAEWDMFFPAEDAPISQTPNPPRGRVQIRAGGITTEVQTPHCLEVPDTAAGLQFAEQLARRVREYALSGVVTPVPAGLYSPFAVPQQQQTQRADQPESAAAVADDGLISLKDAVSEGISTLALSGLRAAAGRGGFPEVRTPAQGNRGALYDRAEIEAWEASRAPAQEEPAVSQAD